MLIYNNIIVGSGPSGYLAFKKIKKNSLIITGETDKKVSSAKVHPKIKLELNKKTNKVADLISSKTNNFSIYSSSEIGGLTNYWGKQFFDYKKDDYWPKSIFKKFSTYQKNLKIIDKMYPQVTSKIIRKMSFDDLTISQLTPPIFKTTVVDKIKLKNDAKKKLIQDRVISFKKIKKNLVKVFTEKGIFYCKNLILCAGPIGNALILFRSFERINYLKFKDNNPRMIFGLRIGKKLYHITKKTKLMDFGIFKNNKLLAYSTIYNIDPNHFNLYFRPFVKIFSSLLKKFFFYGQFWISDEYNEIKLKKDADKYYLSAKTINPKKNKISIIKKLDNIGFTILKTKNLNFGYGFHYHCLQINYKGKLFLFNEFINKLNLQNEVFCFDSSVIEKIFHKPPTKTYLATTNYLVDNFLKKK